MTTSCRDTLNFKNRVESMWKRKWERLSRNTLVAERRSPYEVQYASGASIEGLSRVFVVVVGCARSGACKCIRCRLWEFVIVVERRCTCTRVVGGFGLTQLAREAHVILVENLYVCIRTTPFFVLILTKCETYTSAVKLA